MHTDPLEGLTVASGPGCPDPRNTSVPETGRRYPGGPGIRPNGTPVDPAEVAA
ncbi:hypothetical protein KPATCC21470_1852 [Kitasatospora purpeofusca]